MRFKSDDQRKAVMSSLNKLSLYRKGDFLKSTEYPQVNVYIGDYDPSPYLEDIPEQHLSGLGALRFLRGHAQINKEPKPEGNVQLGEYDSSVDFDFGEKYTAPGIFLAEPKYITPEIPKVGPGWKKPDELIGHELGHHVTMSSFGSKEEKMADHVGRELVADEYLKNIMGTEPRWWPIDEEEKDVIGQVAGYAEALHEFKNPSIKKQMRDAGIRFSFWERKHKGWYPRDSNLPDEFPTIVRSVAFSILGKDPTLITPDDDEQLTKLTGEVCSELDKIWMPEWGKRPSGHYLRADVKDAWEDLD